MFSKFCLWSLCVLVTAVFSILLSIPDQAPESKKPELGFKVLSSGDNPTVDIVAIHGLNGHREKSWTSEDGTMWLKDLLPEDIPNARILVYGYDADTRRFTQTSTQNIFRHAEAFVTDLSQMRKENPKRPIIFLAHSLGGIVLKKALAYSHATSFNSAPHHRAIKVSTYAVLFFGTPHSGANGVELAQWLGRVSSVFMYTSGTVLRDLSRDSPELEFIQQAYLHASDKIKTIFFYEEYRTPIRGWFSEMIVPRHLAIIHGERNAEVVVLHADHIQMVKFGGRSDGDYVRVAEYLISLGKEAPVKVQQNWIQERGHRTIESPWDPPQNLPLPKPRPAVSRNYVERPEIQGILTRNLLPSNSLKLQPRCVLHGLAGSGKTQLASFWIEKNQNRFTSIIYIDAISRHEIEADLQTAIKSVGPQYSEATWKDAVAYLSHKTGWILLFDNADAPDLRLEEYLPNSVHGAVLITTRNRDFAHYAQECDISVGKLSEREALDLLHAVANFRPPSDGLSIAIVNELGRLALAVTQAGAYIFETRDFDMYLRIFRKHRDGLLRDGSLKGRNYNWSTYAAFEMSFNQLPPKSREFMSICAFLHHSLIPRALFQRSTASQFGSRFTILEYSPLKHSKTTVSYLEDLFGSQWDEFEFQSLIRPVMRHSLIDTSANDHLGYFYDFYPPGMQYPLMVTSDNDHLGSFYNIHPLVHIFIQDLHTRAENDHYALLAGQLLLGAIKPIHHAKNNHWYRQLSSHIDSLPVRVKQANPFDCQAFADVYESVGNWNASQPLRNYTYIQFAENRGPWHPETIDAMNSLGLTLFHCGQHEEAEVMQREALVRYKQVLGLRHSNTIRAMINLSLTLSSRGQLEEAERMQREVLVLWKNVLGLRHVDKIKAMNGLALTLFHYGQFREAEMIQREVLVLYKEVLGLLYPHTIAVMGNLALTLSSRAQFEEAVKMQREVLEIQKEILGLQHPDTIRAMSNLGLTLVYLGQLEEGEKVQRKALVLLRKFLGKRHADTIRATTNLYRTLISGGQLDRAAMVGFIQYSGFRSLVATTYGPLYRQIAPVSTVTEFNASLIVYDGQCYAET